MKRWRKPLALLLAVVLVVGVANLPSKAQGESESTAIDLNFGYDGRSSAGLLLLTMAGLDSYAEGQTFTAVSSDADITYNGVSSTAFNRALSAAGGMYLAVDTVSNQVRTSGAQNGDIIRMTGVWQYNGDQKYYDFGTVTYIYQDGWSEVKDLSFGIDGRSSSGLLLLTIDGMTVASGEPTFQAVSADADITFNEVSATAANRAMTAAGGLYLAVDTVSNQARTSGAQDGDIIALKGIWKYNGDGQYYDFGVVSYKFNGSNWEEYVPEVAPTDVTFAVHGAHVGNKNLLLLTVEGMTVAATGEPLFTAVSSDAAITYNGVACTHANQPRTISAGLYLAVDEISNGARTTGAQTGDIVNIKGVWQYAADNQNYNFGDVSFKWNGSSWEEYVPTVAPTDVTFAVHGAHVGNKNLLLLTVEGMTVAATGEPLFTAVSSDAAITYNGVACTHANQPRTISAGLYLAADEISNGSRTTGAQTGDIVNIKGVWQYTADNQNYNFGDVSFQWNGGAWEVYDPTVVEDPMDEAQATIYDLYDLESVSQKAIAENALYNLTNLKLKTNVGLKLRVLDGLSHDAIFTLSKHVANNVWVDSGYQIKLAPEVGEIRIITEADTIQASANGIDYSDAFELEFAVVDMYKQGTTEVVARRVYAKIDGVEVVSWLDKNLDRTLGTYSPAWAQDGAVVESITHQGYLIVSKTAKVQDVSELTDGLSKVSTKPNGLVLVGAAKEATNNAIRFKVDLGTKFNTQGQEMKFCFSNNSIASMWAGEDSGYKVAIRPGEIEIQYGGDDTRAVFTGYTFPEDEFIMEIGTYDMEIQKDGVKVSDYARVVYAKVDDQEVISWADKDMDRNLGKNMWVYTSENVQSELVSLTSDRYLIKEQVQVYDLFNTSKLSMIQLAQGRETKLGETKTATNIAFRSKVKLDGNVSEFKLALAKTVEGQYWDADASGWQFWFRPTSGQVFIGYGVDEYGALCGYTFPDEFVLEIGERNTKYNDGKRYAREIYISVDGKEILTYKDTDYQRKLGTYVTAWAAQNGTVTLNSLTTTGYVPVEKSIGVQDFFDVSGYAQMKITPNECTSLGEMKGKNSAVKMRVHVTKNTDEFKIGIAKTDPTTLWEAEQSGYQFWFRPASGQIFIGYGMDSYATLVGYGFPNQDFILEVGSKDVYYENGKHYGYQVYIKIDGVVVTSWIDEDISGRKMGNYVVAYGSANSDVTFSTLNSSYDLPVVYRINGEDKTETVFAEVQATVVLNKPSKVTVNIKPNPDYSVNFAGVTLNEEDLETVEVPNAPLGFYTYEPKAARGDQLIVHLDTLELTTDEPQQVLDIYDVMKKESVQVESGTDTPIGCTVDEEGRNRINTAVQMKVTIPEAINQIRWSMFSDAYHIWGYNGFIVKLTNNKVGIYYTASESKLAEANCASVKGNAILYVESGAVKCYEAGEYKYDRYYVKVGESLESMELVCWYDSIERGSYGTTMAAYGMDIPGSYTISSAQTIRTITDVTEKTEKENLKTYDVYGEKQYAAYYPETVVDSREATIRLYVKDGKILSKLIVAGQDVTSKVTKVKDGVYQYEIPSVKSDTTFSYVIK